MTRQFDHVGTDAWAHCRACDLDFRLGASIPCPLDVYLAALKAARCPDCGTRTNLIAYSPGLTPTAARAGKGFALKFGV